MSGTLALRRGLIWGALVLGAVLIVLVRLQPPKGASLPGQTKYPVIRQVHAFTLTNQLGQVVRLSDLRGKLWVADLIFTRCVGSCPIITQRMSELERQLPVGAKVRLVTLTCDPVNDTPTVLQRYAKRFGAHASDWWFLTGSEDVLRRLANEDLLLGSAPKKPSQASGPNDLFLHSTKFILVDRQGRVRSIYDGTDPKSIAKVLTGIQALSGVS